MFKSPAARTAFFLCAWTCLSGCVLVPDRGGGPDRDNDRHEGDRHDRLGASAMPAPAAYASDWYAVPARLPGAMAGRYAAPQLRAAILYAHTGRARPNGIWT